jgi:hypothetical protein
MIKKKQLTIINIALVLIAFLLLVRLFGLELPTIGQAQYAIDSNEAVCVVNNWENELVKWDDIDRCCLEVKSKTICDRQKISYDGKELNWMCNTGGRISYLLNHKAYNYCRQQSFWN